MSDNQPTPPNPSKPTSSKEVVLTKSAKKKPIAPLSWLVLIVGILALAWALFSLQKKPEAAPVETITREGVITQIQNLNRLQTVLFSVDTIISSQKRGSWQKLWQDEQKGLFIARGRVEAGVDLSELSPEMVQVVPPKVTENAAENDPKAAMPTINITLPPSQIFTIYLDDLEIYDWQTGAFNLLQVDPKVLEAAQQSAKKEVLERACRGNIMNLAAQNAQSQLQQLFALTGAVVTVNTQGTGACQLPIATTNKTNNVK